jgi:hypothetical protein
MSIHTVSVRAGTAAEWADLDATDGAAAPILGDGELAVVTDTDEVRVGDGSTAFATLPAHLKAKARGTATLVGGTKNVTGLTGVAAGDILIATVRSLGTVAVAKAILAVAGTNQITVTSADGTDTSVVQFVVFPA